MKNKIPSNRVIVISPNATARRFHLLKVQYKDNIYRPTNKMLPAQCRNNEGIKISAPAAVTKRSLSQKKKKTSRYLYKYKLSVPKCRQKANHSVIVAPENAGKANRKHLVESSDGYIPWRNPMCQCEKVSYICSVMNESSAVRRQQVR